MEARALANFTFHPDAAVVDLDDVAGNGEAEAGAANFARAGRIHPIKALENSLLIGPRNADSRVGDGKDDFMPFGAGTRGDLAAGRGVLNGVVEEVLENFLKAVGITEHQG